MIKENLSISGKVFLICNKMKIFLFEEESSQGLSNQYVALWYLVKVEITL